MNEPGYAGRQQTAIAAALALLLAGAWGILLWSSNRGFGFIDEGYYLTTIAAPRHFPNQLSDFGYFFHPLFKAAHGDVGLLRIGGALVLEIAALIFGGALARFLILNRGQTVAIVLATAMAVWWQYGWWRLSTPSYNQINLCGLLLLFSGAMEAVTLSRGRTSGCLRLSLPALLAGAGLAISALNKPPSALLGAILALVWLFTMPVRHRWRYLLATAVFTLAVLMAAALAFHGSIGGYFDSLWSGYAVISQMSGHGAAQAIAGTFAPPFDGDRPLRLAVAAILLAAIGIAAWFWTRLATDSTRSGKRRNALLTWTPPLAAGVWMAYARGSLNWPNHVCLHALQFAFPAFLAGMTAHVWYVKKNYFWRNEAAKAALLLLLVPMAYSLGTFTLIYFNLPGSAIFWAAALLAVARTSSNLRLLNSTALLCGTITLGFLIGFACRPLVNGASMLEQKYPVTVGSQKAVLLVDTDTRDYLSALSSAAAAHGFRNGDPLFDFSLSGPGAGFALGAKAPGTPYIGYGGPPFWNAILLLVSPLEGRRAWVLIDARNRDIYRLPWQERFGRRFPQDYELAGRLDQRSFGVTNLLWKPRGP